MESESIPLSNSCPHELKKSVDAISILLVDDDTTCLAIVAAILKKFKYEVVTVKHANDALCTLRIKGATFDLVMSDVHMPDMNGFQLQQAIAQEFNLPVVLMSADDKEGTALKGLENGAAFFIYKPVSPDDVRDLWQFAAMNKKSQVVIEEENEEDETNYQTRKRIRNDDVMISVYESDSATSNKDSKRKSPRNEGSDDKKGETTSQCANSQKRPKIIWTNSLHNRFLEAIRSIGLDRAVPKKILEVMNVPGLTRENVASHLQKYRIFLRRVSDASYKIQYSPDNGLNNRNLLKSNLEPSSTTTPSTLILNGLNNFPYQKTPQLYFPSEASSGFGQSRFLTNRGLNNNLRLNISNADIINHNVDNPYIHNSTLLTPNITMEDLSSALSATLNPDTNPNFVHPTNYVGYSIANVAHHGESGLRKECQGLNSNSNSSYDINLGGQRFSIGGGGIVQTLNENNIDDVDDNNNNNNNNNDSTQLSENIHMHSRVRILESPYSPFFYMSQPDFGSTLEDRVNVQNLQVSGKVMFHLLIYLLTRQECSTSSQLNEPVLAPPIEQHNDDDFLESLLAPFGEDQTFEGIEQ
ncbi:two-component response regulator ARR13 [Striga asiatica]|uniref:Two-component response regulator ARR13 n=1 Tax=Striga asiatica TaxID=4170 RepID=A0A5A7PQD4_STRAF|nr:two-component response regulator ARR13 [Striga asiatica]